MEYEWYADLFFLEEAYRDVLIVWLAAALMRKRTAFLRLLAAGTAGGICSTVILYLELTGKVSGIVSEVIPGHLTGIAARSTIIFRIWETGKLLVTGLFMAQIAFPKKRSNFANSRDFLAKVFTCRGKELGVFVLSAGILQGGLAILRERFFLTGWKSLIFMGCFSMGVHLFAAALVRRPMIGETRYQVRLFLNEKSKEFTAMVDSGNRLVEPVTGKPVSLIAASDVKSFGDEPVGVLMIPFRAVGTKSGFLPGILFDRMEIVSEECGNVRIDRPVVAVSKEPLFHGKDFTMILPECLVDGAKWNCGNKGIAVKDE